MRRIDLGRRFLEYLTNLLEDVSVVNNGRSVELLRKMGQPGWTALEDSIWKGVRAPSTTCGHAAPEHLYFRE